MKGADFKEGANGLAVKVKGKGRIELYLDGSEDLIGYAEFDCKESTVVTTELIKKITGEHDIEFVISNGFEFDQWQFVE